MRVLAFVTLIVLAGSAEVNGAQLTVSWIDNSGGVATFSIERRLDSATTFAMIGSAPAGITSYVDGSVIQGSTYCYRLLAYDTSAVSSYSNEACGSPSTNVTINKTGTGTGTVTSTPSGTWITLVAIPDAGSVFVGWSGGTCTGTDPCVFAGNTPVTVAANFATMSATSSSPVALGLTYNGKLRDRVGPGNAALSADGALDGTLTATLSASGGRTITALQLTSTRPGIWDTDASSSYWALGVATALDGPLNDPVNLAVPDGGSFVLFASDYAGIEFVPGTSFTLTATFSDGTTATATTTVDAFSVAYNGKLRDRVGPADTALVADGMPDGTLTATLNASGGRTVTALRLRSTSPGIWDTNTGSRYWMLGVATALDGPLVNDPATKAVRFAVADGGTFSVFASDYADIEFVPGTSLDLTATFSDGTTATATTTVEGLSVTYDGKLRDRVGASTAALVADGMPDGTLTAKLSARGGRTITALRLQSTGPGIWNTDAGDPYWSLGVATALDRPLINDPGTAAVNFAVPDGGSFVLFASDYAGTEFTPGATLTLTAWFSDGTAMDAVVRVP